jgi:hypothetical protein
MPRRKPGARSAFTRLRGPVAACLAIFALLAQMLAPPVHQAGNRAEVAGVASELKALFGDAAVLCIQVEDGKRAPAPSRDCDDFCPLCQFHSGAHALILPGLAGLPTRIDVGAETLGIAPAPSSHRTTHTAYAQPRAPPLEA